MAKHRLHAGGAASGPAAWFLAHLCRDPLGGRAVPGERSAALGATPGSTTGRYPSSPPVALPAAAGSA
ncbi:MAG: hypothetical protein OXJ90_06265, partial [Spirochaetaceae bacterium]|nr:hypothetical protein [Spirochaetaceae bacterium]